MASRVVRNPDILGGQPIIEGTRWPTETVVAFKFSLSDTHDSYPHLTAEQIVTAIIFEQSLNRRLRRLILYRTRKARRFVAEWLESWEERL